MPPAKVGPSRLQRDSYHLIIRQAPRIGKSFSGKEKDRKPVDPPPIVQLFINDANDPAQNYLQSPYYMCVCALWHETEDKPADDPTLAGTVVSSLHRLKDSDNRDGGFFVFPDISVKSEGDFRLKFTLWELKEGLTESLQTVTSRAFKVHPAKTFPGLAESTFLTRSFSDQGVRLRIRKETRTSIKRSVSEAENGQYTHDGSSGPPPGSYAQPSPYTPTGYPPEYPGVPKRQKSTGGQGFPEREAWQYSPAQASPAAYGHPGAHPVSGYYQEAVSGPPQMEYAYRGPPVADNGMGQHGYWSRPPMQEYQHVPHIQYGSQARPDGSNGMQYAEGAYNGIPGSEPASTISSSSSRGGDAHPAQSSDPSRSGYRSGVQGGTSAPPNTLPPISSSSQSAGPAITSPPHYSTYGLDGRYAQHGGARSSFAYPGQGCQVPATYT